MAEQTFHSGFTAIVGSPNVGKSTLINRLVGEKISIVSSKPQTTRSRLMGVMNGDQWQIVLVDTPGVNRPRTRLGEFMEASVTEAMKGIDALMVVVDASHITDRDRQLVQDFSARKVYKVLVYNKLDLVTPQKLLEVMAEFRDLPFDSFIPLSASTGEGVDALIQDLSSHMPLGPRYFPEDMVTDQPEQVLCAELIREKALLHLREEVPHGIGVEILRFEKHKNATEIDATMYCEKESHKRIIIGKGGQTLRQIGQEAREDMEQLFGYHIYLQLWVKVRPGWRNSADDLKTLGYVIK